MKYIKNIFKISIILLLLLVCVASINAADDSQITLSDDLDDDFELDEDLDDDLDEDDDEGPDDDLDDDWEDEDLDDEDLDDINESDYTYTDFDYLKLKITYYLDRYGNCSSHNWTESEEFVSEYQIYLADPSNYTLNESSEGYETYLKIFDSITSTFNDYNLTENETAYLKFMVIFYLNHYGNVSANYTWNESESFSNFTLPFDILASATGLAIAPMPAGHDYNRYLNPFNPIYSPLTNSTDINQTSTDNQLIFDAENSWDFNIFMLILVLFLMIAIFI